MNKLLSKLERGQINCHSYLDGLSRGYDDHPVAEGGGRPSTNGKSTKKRKKPKKDKIKKAFRIKLGNTTLYTTEEAADARENVLKQLKIVEVVWVDGKEYESAPRKLDEDI